jgi:hypothetical protein
MADIESGLVRQQSEGGELTIEQMANSMSKLRELMQKVMVKDEDYGIIAGGNEKRPTLLQPGAEKLAMMFRFAPEYKIERVDLPGGHREYYVTCRLVHIPTGHFAGEATASCSTMEVKYRYRGNAAESTGRQVPGNYWDVRKHDPKAAQQLLGGPDFVTKKIDGAWMICKKTGERIENPDLAETYNTVCQISQKRSFLRAIRQATGASNLFTQDLDEKAVDDAGDDHGSAAAGQHAKPEPAKPEPPSVTPEFEKLRLTLYSVGVPRGNLKHADAVCGYAREGVTLQQCAKDNQECIRVLDELDGFAAVGDSTDEIYFKSLTKAGIPIPEELKSRIDKAVAGSQI